MFAHLTAAPGQRTFVEQDHAKVVRSSVGEGGERALENSEDHRRDLECYRRKVFRKGTEIKIWLSP